MKDYLKHWVTPDKHKYVQKIEVKPKQWRYFYTMEEYRAYLADKNAKDKSVGTQNSAKQQPTPTNSKSSNSSNSSNKVESLFNSAKQFLSKSSNVMQEKASDFIENSKSAISNAQRNLFGEDFDKKESKNNQSEIAPNTANGAVGNNDSKSLKAIAKTITKSLTSWIDVIKTDRKKNKLTRAANEAKEKRIDRFAKDHFDYSQKIDNNAEADRDKGDAIFSDSECVDNIKNNSAMKHAIMDTFDVDEDDIDAEFLKKVTKCADNENLSDALQRSGWFDEKEEGAHPSSFSELNKIDYNVDDDANQYMINADKLYRCELDGDEEKVFEPNPYPVELSHDGDSQNCAYCTLAYEMRKRGYDVEAADACATTCNTYEVIESWYEGGKFAEQSKNCSVENIRKTILENNPEGSRGQFCCQWLCGGGHSMLYEVRGGEVYIRDCQTNKEYSLSDSAARISKLDSSAMYEFTYMRTDNLKLTDNSLVGVKNKRRDKNKKSTNQESAHFYE